MSVIQTLSRVADQIVKVSNRALATVQSEEAPAATFEASKECEVANQQRALKKLGLGPASAAWQSSDVRFSGHTRPQGQPENWGELKQNLVTYLDGAQNRRACTRFANGSKGYALLDKSGEIMDATRAIENYRAPGSVTVSMHGVRPVLKNGEINPERNRTPFWDGTEPHGLRTTAEFVELLRPHLKAGDDAPIFLNVCNAGTESKGIVPAADVSRRTGRYVIAPVDSRVLGTGRGPQLNDKGGEWRVFHPDGTSELLYKPTAYPGWEKGH
ncbi:MAG: hypothetical protein KF760_20785 [Candidatus Eremiobacteraeota bacterium]|nr:hypothetical protein [Candidatus Eremiobacteraeota bacterium]MCW5871556.1 hypothetical protein [Candidatus Eremiobacteraeota bacterium]